MKKRFENITEITKNKIIRFNYFNLLNNKLLLIVLLYMPVIWLVSGIGIFIKESDTRRLVISILLTIVWLALVFLPPYLSVKRKYKIKDYTNEYEFYEDKLVAKNEFTSEEIPYSSLYKVYETKRYFYFYINKKNALIVEKGKFKNEACGLFVDFIKTKLNKRYKKIYF